MSKIRLTRLFSFEAAHALQNYNGPCRNIHGHTYKLEVTVVGSPLTDSNHPKNGMVIDFGDLKILVQEQVLSHVGHALLLNQNTPDELVESLRRHHYKLLLLPYQPTCENMLLDFRNRLHLCLPPQVELYSLKLWETQLSFASWFASDN